jgi:hypothetical protein
MAQVAPLKTAAQNRDLAARWVAQLETAGWQIDSSDTDTIAAVWAQAGYPATFVKVLNMPGDQYKTVQVSPPSALTADFEWGAGSFFYAGNCYQIDPNSPSFTSYPGSSDILAQLTRSAPTATPVPSTPTPARA